MKKKLLWRFAPVLVSVALLGACSDGTGPARTSGGQDPLVARLVEMGFRPDQIVDRGDYFVVEGDIRFEKKDLRAAPRGGGAAHPGGPSRQRVVSQIASNRRTIHVDLSAVDAENASWASATRAAMANWSAVTGADILLVEGGTADVTVGFVSGGANCEAAHGAFPLGGAPGGSVVINREYAATYSYAQQVWIMTHELGHNIGLGHTNTSDGSQITGTPPSDGASVMNSGAAYPGCPPSAPDWSALSYYDEAAVRSLYPLPSVTGVTATNSGGEVIVSWSAVSGASYYEYQHVEITHHSRNGSSSSGSGWTPVNGTSVDTYSTYTGVSSCNYVESDYVFEMYFNWEVRAVFPNGKRSVATVIESRDAAC